MWQYRYLRWIDWRTIPILLSLMAISILVIASTTGDLQETGWETLLTPYATNQLKWYLIGWGAYLFFAGMDYGKLKKWAIPLYLLMIFMLFGLFFTAPIQNVQRWYRIAGLTFQPSEYAKLIVVIVLSWFLERQGRIASTLRVAWQGSCLVLIPFMLILKQPDLGTSLVLYPIALVLFYLAGVHRRWILWMQMLGAVGVIFISLFFLGILPHETMRPYATTILKDYQYERLNPDTYHQQAAQTAIGLGGWTGSGWHKSEFTGRQWLPAAHTDSVFAAYGEEFGVIGIFLLLLFFFGLLYFCFQVTAVAKDAFGRLLSAGITAYLAVHVIVNAGMMCGFLPITGVPLILVTYGGSSILSTMMALGILQSIYSRRFMF
ncbi:MAG: rod shape-determining protein RodA [Simkania sp.]|nr:rod shape-determining protein RodA [Simkania sp.]